MPNNFNSDFLVIGSAIAGLSYALDVAEHGSVNVICKSEATEGSTRYAQGGVASVTDPLDSFADHIKDTIDCGAGLCKEDIVKTVVTEGPNCVEKLIARGARFDTTDTMHYSLGQEGGHSKRRILHAGDSTGFEIQTAIINSAKEHKNICLHDNHFGIDLILNDQGMAQGLYALNTSTAEVTTFTAKIILLATGGAGKVYLYTSNPAVSTGDGIAMAYRAGAKISNMEFFQFHPTCLYHEKANHFLLTEALRGEGAYLLNEDGQRFMFEYDKRGELAPRDIVARAIDDQMKRSGNDYVYLDISHKDSDFIKDRFPTIFKRTSELGFDISKEAVPVVPAAHYCCGGVLCDSNGRTSIENLYVAGESACTGLHGANRLASNSLLEALVFADRAAKDSIEAIETIATPQLPQPWDSGEAVESNEQVMVSHFWDECRRTMWNLVGIVRSSHRLELAGQIIARIARETSHYYWNHTLTLDLLELRNLVTVSEIIVFSAKQRKESRGLHFNKDFPNTKPTAVDTVLAKGQDGFCQSVQ